MVKSSSIWVDQLVQLLGLDKETVTSQIIPFLDSFDERNALQTHLEGLLGTGDPKSKTFTTNFVQSCFPQPPAPQPTLAAASAPKPLKQGKGKKSLSVRAGIGKPLPPRQIQGQDQKMEELNAAFGGMGMVYIKKRDEDLDYFGGKGKTKSGTPSSAQIPVETEAVAPKAQAASMFAKQEEQMTPTAETLAIDAVIKELTEDGRGTQTVSSVKDITYKRCFCQGRKHSLAPHVPLCLSCGLVICSALYPTPLSPLSSCPSCAASPLLSSGARSKLVSKLASERELLVEQQHIQARLIREERARNKEKKQEDRTLFPELGSNASSNSVPSHVFGKHGGLARACGVAQDAQRTAKVLNLNMKAHKLTVARTKPKPNPKSVNSQPAAADDEPEQEENDDEYTALDGSPLVFDFEDDGYAMHFPVKAIAAEKGRGKGRDTGPARWTVRSTSAEVNSADQETADYVRYIGAEERERLLPNHEEEDAESVAAEATSSTKFAESTPNKVVPGAAVPNSKGKKKQAKP